MSINSVLYTALTNWYQAKKTNCYIHWCQIIHQLCRSTIKRCLERGVITVYGLFYSWHRKLIAKTYWAVTNCIKWLEGSIQWIFCCECERVRRSFFTLISNFSWPAERYFIRPSRSLKSSLKHGDVFKLIVSIIFLMAGKCPRSPACSITCIFICLFTRLIIVESLLLFFKCNKIHIYFIILQCQVNCPSLCLFHCSYAISILVVNQVK